MKTILLAGGGTAGHIMPNIALLPDLNENFDRVIYAGAENGMERRIAESKNLEFFPIPAVKFSRSNPLSNFKIPFALSRCVKSALALLEREKPDVVFSKGGYVSLPVVLAARRAKIPYVIHESDSSLGLANKLAARGAAMILTAAETEVKNAVVVGNPLRAEIFEGNPTLLKKNFKDAKPVLLILGGSTGARAINDCVYKSLPSLLSRFNVLHAAGKTMDPSVKADGYIQTDFVENVNDWYAAADYAVSRAGAIASAELLALGKKVLFIPLPKGASRGDQLENARRAAEKNYALVLEQEKLTPFTLQKSLYRLQKAAFAPFPYDRATPRRIVKLLTDCAKFVE